MPAHQVPPYKAVSARFRPFTFSQSTPIGLDRVGRRRQMRASNSKSHRPPVWGLPFQQLVWNPCFDSPVKPGCPVHCGPFRLSLGQVVVCLTMRKAHLRNQVCHQLSCSGWVLCVITAALNMKSLLLSVHLSVPAGRQLTQNAVSGVRLNLLEALSGYLRLTNAVLNTKEKISNTVVNMPP